MELKQISRCCFLAILFFLVSKEISAQGFVDKTFFCPDEYNYRRWNLYTEGITVDLKTSITFEAKGRNDAHILLQRNRNDFDNNIIEIVLGGWGNSISVIRNRQQGPSLSRFQGPVLNDASFNPFWISWGGGCVEVGKGSTVGTNRIMDACSVTDVVTGISISYGFGSSGYFKFDADVDECTNGTDNCDVDAQCTNTIGSFTCACNIGYSGNGVTCTDVDECTAGTDNCDGNAACTNTVGSYTCVCNAGYTGNGTTCTDVDECASTPCQNGGQCINGQNMFTCVCSSRWTGTTCQTGFVCNPDNTIDVSNLPANYSYFAMQTVTSGPDVECTVTDTSSTSIQISGCSKDLDILLTYSTYSGMSPKTLHGGKSLTAVIVRCNEISDNGTELSVNNKFEVDLIVSSDTDVAPTYSVDSSLSTNSTTVGSGVTWTITFPEEYILEVTSCTAYPGSDDSSSGSVSLISDGGCTMTDELISNFTDHGNGSVTATILAFKFYDNDYVFLQCDLKVCPNDSSACDTQCSGMKWSVYKRSVHERTSRDSLDKYYTSKVNTVLRVVEPEIQQSGATQVSPLNQNMSFVFSILLVLLVRVN